MTDANDTITDAAKLADKIEGSCHMTIEHGLVGGTLLEKRHLDLIVAALRSYSPEKDANRNAIAQGLRTMADNLWHVEHRIDVDADAELLLKAAAMLSSGSQSSPDSGWQPIDTAPKDDRVLFWMDWADDCKPLNNPISESARIYYGFRGAWSSLYKATLWLRVQPPSTPITSGSQSSPDSSWQLVPKQPTQAMCDAARQSWVNDQGPKVSTLWGSEAADIYRAMLKAAPVPSGYGSEGER